MMRNLFVFLFIFSLQGHSSIFSQSRMTVDLQNANMKELIRIIEKQTSLGFLYDVDLENVSVTVKAQDETVENILNSALKNSDLKYEIEHNTILIYKKAEDTKSGLGQPVYKQRTVTGKVIDGDGNPVPGANVVLLERRQGVATDRYGNYKILVPNDRAYTLLYTFIGMEEQRVTVKPEDAETQEMRTIILKTKQAEIEEVLVTGIFNKPKAAFTGAASVITKEEIKRSGNRNLLKTLSTIDPSFDVQEQNEFGSDPNNTNLAIQIRGASSIPDVNDMQLTARNQLNTPLFILDGFEVSMERVLDMNQNDVESVVILKDASATAIYGSRGSNGVVVITSSHPPVGKLRITYTAGVNLEIRDLSSYDLMNSKEKLHIEEVAGLYTTDDPDRRMSLLALHNANRKAVAEGVDTDWLHIPTRTGVGQYHRLGIGGGDAQFRYDLNVSFNQIAGAMKGSERQNVNAGMTLQYLFKNIRISNLLELGFNKGTNSPYGRFSDYHDMNPYWRPYDENGDPVVTYNTFADQIKYNPLYDASLTSFSKSDYSSVRNQTSMSVNITPALKWDTSFGLSQLKGGSDLFISPLTSTYIIGGIDMLSRGSYTQGYRKETSFQVSTTLNYGKTFGKHSVFAGINGQMMETKSENSSVSVRGFTNENLNDISNGISYSGDRPTSRESTVRSVGISATMNYSYNERYFIDFSGRIDGASSFGKYSRYAPFYALGLAWNMAKENFMKEKFSFIDQFKLRYSYGVTGSLNFSAYQALETYRYDTNSQYNGISGMELMALGNDKLKWQNTHQHNWGLDINILEGQLGFVLNYYRKNTDNLIAQASLPYSNGYTSYTENFGRVRNKGIDGQLSIRLMNIPEKKFVWYLRLGAYANKNILLELSDAIKTANERFETQQDNRGYYYQYREGHSIDDLYVLKSPGVDPLTGSVLYQDPETGYVYDHAAEGIRKIAMGSTLPKVNGRFGTSLRYKGLTVDLNFSVRYGAMKLNNSLMRVENAFVRINMDKRVLDSRWVKEGDISAYKDLGSEESTYAIDRFVTKEKAFSLSNVNIGYQFPDKWLQSFKIQQAMFSASLSDVFYISNIKTVRGTDYPYTIKPTFNLSVTF